MEILLYNTRSHQCQRKDESQYSTLSTFPIFNKNSYRIVHQRVSLTILNKKEITA